MAMSNAERQARWRSRQAEKLDRVIEAEVARRLAAAQASAQASTRCAACADKDREIARLRAAKLRAAKPRPPVSASEAEAKLRAQIRELRIRLRRLVERTSGREVYMLKSEWRTMMRVLHPDLELDPARKQLLTRASQIFNALSIREVDPD
jgi:hypothetical protein